ncbi:MAG: hypothetical protein GTO02_16595 [Candidatus Dadabacteria bacterium]|nr:hypothetical protein [Candidatus Dadabacteria bacterium]
MPNILWEKNGGIIERPRNDRLLLEAGGNLLTSGGNKLGLHSANDDNFVICEGMLCPCPEVQKIPSIDCSPTDVCIGGVAPQFLEVTLDHPTKPTILDLSCGVDDCDIRGTFCCEILSANFCDSVCSTNSLAAAAHAWSYTDGIITVCAEIFKHISDGHWYFYIIAKGCTGAATPPFHSTYVSGNSVGGAAPYYDLGTTKPTCTTLNISGSGGAVTPITFPFCCCDFKTAADWTWTAKAANC